MDIKNVYSPQDFLPLVLHVNFDEVVQTVADGERKQGDHDHGKNLSRLGPTRHGLKQYLWERRGKEDEQSRSIWLCVFSKRYVYQINCRV